MGSGRKWLKMPVEIGSTATAARDARRAAENFPHTYSPGRRGVECSSGPTFSSSSRTSGVPAATATKKATKKKPIKAKT